MHNLTVTLIQSPLHWHAPEKNRVLFSKKIDALDGTTDLIILPEMFTTGFTMAATELAETMTGPTVEWMHTIAHAKNAVITGSLIIEDNGHYYNRLIWMPPNGALQYYDKRHLFRMAKEHAHYTAGHTRPLFMLHGWRVCPLICYDLRFPVWSRNNSDNAFDLLVFVANWPRVRHGAWKALLKARAIENSAYVVGVNRVGQDDNDIDYAGDSVALNYLGESLIDCADRDTVQSVPLDYQALQDFRARFPAHQDADRFTIDL